jgi:hypothetical protein
MPKIRVRKLLVFLISVAMIVGGGYLLWGEMLYVFVEGHPIRIFIVAGTIALPILGAYLLWIDIAAPLLGIKTGEE